MLADAEDFLPFSLMKDENVRRGPSYPVRNCLEAHSYPEQENYGRVEVSPVVSVYSMFPTAVGYDVTSSFTMEELTE